MNWRASPPSGSRTAERPLSDGPTPLATVPVTGGQVVFTTGKLQPGAHQLTAAYSGAPGYAPSTSASATVTIGFSQPCLTTVRNGPLTVAAG